MLVDEASRWSVLAFATAHVAGLLTGWWVPWSATLTAVSLLVVAGAALAAASACASTGAPRSFALLAGLAAVAGLVFEVELRGGVGWPFFLTEPPAGIAGVTLEAALISIAVAGLSTAALPPSRWSSKLRATVAELQEPPTPVVPDLSAATPHGATSPARRPRSARWRPHLATAGTVTVAALVLTVAAMPIWRPDHYDQIPLLHSRDRPGLLLATLPVVLAAVAATVTACQALHRSPRRRRAGVALAAGVFVVLAVPVAWARGGDFRYSPEPPPSALRLYSYAYVGTVGTPGGLRPAQVHPGLAWRPEPLGPPGWVDDSWWSRPVDWDELGDGIVAALSLAAFLALTVALLPPPSTGRVGVSP